MSDKPLNASKAGNDLLEMHRISKKHLIVSSFSLVVLVSGVSSKFSILLHLYFVISLKDTLTDTINRHKNSTRKQQEYLACFILLCYIDLLVC